MKMAPMGGVWFWTFSLTLLFSSNTASRVSESAEGRLHKYLLDDYVPIPPPRPSNQSIPVHIRYGLLFLKELDSVEQKLSTTGLITLTWNYDYFQWDPDQYGGTEVLYLPAKMIWKPSILLVNGVNGKYRHQEWEENMATIHHNGFIQWDILAVTQTSCNMDIFLFPMDNQDCSVIIASEVKGLLNFTTSHMDPYLDVYMNSSSWDLNRVQAGIKPLEGSNNHGIDTVTYRFQFSRRPGNVIWTIILPVLVLAVLGQLTFLIPHDSGERLSLGVTVMLSYCMFMTIVSDQLPTSASSTPLLLISLLGLMILQTATVGLSIVTLNLETKSCHWRMPQFLEFTIFQILARVVCIGAPKNDDVQEFNCPEKEQAFEERTKIRLAVKILDRFFFLMVVTIEAALIITMHIYLQFGYKLL